MKPVLFYISGHGYGHSTRMIAVMKELLASDPTVKLFIRTSAREWLFGLDLPRNSFTYYPVEIDVGVVQRDSFTVDQRRTLEKYADLLERKEQLVSREVEFVQSKNIGVIVGDIPPFAFDIADRAGIPSIAISNFSWDWIYQPFAKNLPEFAHLVTEIRASYGKAGLLLRLPFYGDLSAFPTIEDIPLITRKATKTRRQTFEALGIQPEPGQKVVLIALRSEDLQKVNLKKIGSLRSFLFLILHDLDSRGAGGNILKVSLNGVKFPDLVHACDIVLTKPGYGIVTEGIVNQTPLLYTTRDDFLEYEVLVDALQRFTPSQCIPREEFFAGNWGEYLLAIIAREPHWVQLATNGATIAAKKILQYGKD